MGFKNKNIPITQILLENPPASSSLLLGTGNPNYITGHGAEQQKSVDKPWIKNGWLEEACKEFIEMTGYKDNLLGFVIGEDVAGSFVQ